MMVAGLALPGPESHCTSQPVHTSPQVHETTRPQVHKFTGPQVHRSKVPLVHRSTGPKFHRSTGPQFCRQIPVTQDVSTVELGKTDHVEGYGSLATYVQDTAVVWGFSAYSSDPESPSLQAAAASVRDLQLQKFTYSEKDHSKQELWYVTLCYVTTCTVPELFPRHAEPEFQEGLKTTIGEVLKHSVLLARKLLFTQPGSKACSQEASYPPALQRSPSWNCLTAL